jgi:CRISPR-associated protein Csb1
VRRLRFVSNAGGSSPADVGAQTVLAALALAALAAQDRNGYFLRSRCDLVPEIDESNCMEIIRSNGDREAIGLDFDIACRLLVDAGMHAKELGVTWNVEDLVLKPQGKLVQLVKESRTLALRGDADVGDDGAGEEK